MLDAYAVYVLGCPPPSAASQAVPPQLSIMVHVLLPIPLQVLSDEDCLGDNWAGDRCQSLEAVKEAPSIALGIQAQMSFDSCSDQAWRERCPSQSYTYTIDIKTSCNIGAGTDGYVQVALTGSE